MALSAHMRPYSYMYCAPYRDGVLYLIIQLYFVIRFYAVVVPFGSYGDKFECDIA